MFSLYLVKSATISILSVFGSNRMASKNWRYSPLYFYFCLNMIFMKLFVFKIEFTNMIDSYIIDQNFSHPPHCFLGIKKNLDALYPSFSFFLCLALNLKKIKVKFQFFSVNIPILDECHYDFENATMNRYSILLKVQKQMPRSVAINNSSSSSKMYLESTHCRVLFKSESTLHILQKKKEVFKEKYKEVFGWIIVIIVV